MSQSPKLIQALRGQVHDCPPMWLMRQAGRYLPEYLETRAEAGDFLSLCYNPELAAQVTLQPIERFEFDAAIIFSDILVIPHGLGQKVWFEAGEGPRLEPLTSGKDLAGLSLDKMAGALAPVYEAVSLTRQGLDKSKALIGFCGAPWTVATYMIEGSGSKDHIKSRAFAYNHPDTFREIIDLLIEASVQHLQMQIAAGAQVVQVFDSWAGSLTPGGFEQWCIDPIAKITAKIRAANPTVPVIGFARGAGAGLIGFANNSLVDAAGLDTSIDLTWAHRNLPANLPVQGNFDPALLMSTPQLVREAVLKIRRQLRGRPHVFNLGHGIDKTSDIALVHELVDAVRMPLDDLAARVEPKAA